MNEPRILDEDSTMGRVATALFLYSAALVGCAGQAESEVVARLSYVADAHGALQARRCLDGNDSAERCIDYPNPSNCETLDVVVTAASTAYGRCATKARGVLRLNSVVDGIPIMCRTGTAPGCVDCVDLFYRPVASGCPGGVSVDADPEAGRSIALALIGQGVAPYSESTTTTAGQTVQRLADAAQPLETVQELIATDTGETRQSGPPTQADGNRQPAESPPGPAQQQTVGQQATPPPGPARQQTVGQQTTPSQPVSQVQPTVAPPRRQQETVGQRTTPSRTEPPGYAPSVPCLRRAARTMLSHVNRLLRDEPHALTPIPTDLYATLRIPTQPARGVCGRAGGSQLQTSQCEPQAQAQGGCHCWKADAHRTTRDVSCWCGRINATALRRSCGDRPANCSLEDWETGLLMTYQARPNPREANCWGSPLVVDLLGDGIRLTSLEKGTSFALSGGAPQQTAWIAGPDDALLAIDSNGNGLIDGGHELFGEAPGLTGEIPHDGFDALAVLDRTEFGGDGNGAITPNDALFGALLLWRDVNRDGISQPHELRPLISAGIRSLGTRGQRQSLMLDQHGNDLSLRGRFVQDDGTVGSVVDVYFRTGAGLRQCR